MLIWEMLHDFIILTTLLLYLFNQGDFHESVLFFSKAKNWKLKFTGAFKTSRFGCTVNFVFASLYLWCLVDDS